MMSDFDYHSICNIRSPVEYRREKNIGDVYENKARCDICGDTIRSVNRHDFRNCRCGNLSVDGGSWYLKRCAKDFTKVTELSTRFEELPENEQ